MMAKIHGSGVQAEKFLRPFSPLESKLLSLLTPWWDGGKIVAARRGDHLLVVDVDQAWDLPDRSVVVQQLIGVNDFWDIVFTQKPDQEGFCGLGIAEALQQNFEHETVLVHCPPAVKRAQAVKRGQPRCSDQEEPVSDAINARTDLVQMPAGILS